MSKPYCPLCCSLVPTSPCPLCGADAWPTEETRRGEIIVLHNHPDREGRVPLYPNYPRLTHYAGKDR